MLKYSSLIVFVLLILSACDSSRVYEENVSIPEGEWNQDQAVEFNFNIEDTLSFHNLYLNIRNTGKYPYSNIFLFVNTLLPDGRRGRDTVEVILAEQDGKWKGSGIGDIWDNRTLFKKDFKFPVAGEYKIQLIQAMRINVLPEIVDAGIRIEKSSGN